MMTTALSSLDTQEVNDLKKPYLKAGITLKNQGRRERTILTLEGFVTYKRTVYVPADKQSAELLWNRYSLKAVIPLDMALGIDKLSFKVSPQMMLDITRRAINSRSYEELQRTYLEDWHIEVSDDHIRRITNYVGQMIYKDDCDKRDIALQHLKWLEMTPERPVSTNHHVLYIEMDGAMFNTRKQENLQRQGVIIT